jgi:hypothetical protein
LFSSPANKRILIGVEVLPAVVMTSYIYWDITLCGLLEVNGHFGGTHTHTTSTFKVEMCAKKETSKECSASLSRF